MGLQEEESSTGHEEALPGKQPDQVMDIDHEDDVNGHLASSQIFMDSVFSHPHSRNPIQGPDQGQSSER
ncbi:hypothetical protein FRC01_000716, partial [Tulasnella sp. 417]